MLPEITTVVTCNAVHPEAETVAAHGVTILPCHLPCHAEGVHEFAVEAGPAPSVWEPWKPQVGDYVLVQAGPECQAYHAKTARFGPVYGRVEGIDRTWDDTTTWVQDALKVGEPVMEYMESAQESIGHHYYIQDALDGNHIALIDEHCCSLELTPVAAETAIAAISALRQQLDAMSPNERLLARIGLTPSCQTKEAGDAA